MVVLTRCNLKTCAVIDGNKEFGELAIGARAVLLPMPSMTMPWPSMNWQSLGLST